MGEEIQKDFFAEAPQKVELEEKSREVLTNIKAQLDDLKAELLNATM